MLKNIPNIIPPALLKALMEMGHSDEIVIADGNYPQLGLPDLQVRLDGHGISEILDAILQLMPLDLYVEAPVTLMAVMANDPYKPVIWEEYKEIIKTHEPARGEESLNAIDRFEFYKRGKQCHVGVTTSEKALYANIILKKGVL